MAGAKAATSGTPRRGYWAEMIAKGKKLHDKRASEAERDWNRQKGRLLKQGY